MSKDELLKNRSTYVKDRVSKVKNKTTEIKRLAKELFLSERTIKRDLER